MARPLGQPVVVENRPGGALTIGIDVVAKAAPDGYTIGMGPIGALAITRHMVAKLPYDIERDLQPVALVSRGHLLLAVTPSLPVHSVRELIELAKKKPGKLVNASSSNGSPGHVAGELFKYLTGTDIVHVPYKGGAMAINDLIAGHVQIMFESLNSIAPLRALGQGARARGERRAPLAGLSRAADDRRGRRAGLRGRHLERRHRARPAAAARCSTKLNAAVNEAIRSPLFVERFGMIGDEPAGGTPEDFAATDPPGFRALGRRRQALGRAHRLNRQDSRLKALSAPGPSCRRRRRRR